MAIFNGIEVLNLTPFAAYFRGYLCRDGWQSNERWIDENKAIRHRLTLVYVNGCYVGVSTSVTPLFKIIEKFHVNDANWKYHKWK